MSATNATPEGEPILFEGRIFKVVERTQVGRSGKILKRQVVKHPGAVGIVPILPDGRVLLIEQYRVALQKTIFEIPAGTRDLTPGESAPEDGEKIELRPKTWDEIDAMIDAEEIVDAKTLVALLTARRKLERER